MAETLKVLDLAEVTPSDDNLRRDVGDVSDLAQSIAFIGLLEPIRVYPNGDGKYHISSGHRRFAALKMLEKEKRLPDGIKFLVRSKGPTDADRQVEMIVENLQRVNLDPIEQAEGVRRLIETHEISIADVATMLGVTQQWVKDRVAMIGLPPVIADAKSAVDGKRSFTVEQLAQFGKLDEKRQARLTKDGKKPSGYEVEEAYRKQQSAENAERLLAKVQKAGCLTVTEAQLKRIIAAELADLSGLDQLVKLKIGDATKFRKSQMWGDVEEVTVTCAYETASEDKMLANKDKVFVLVNEAGYSRFKQCSVKKPPSKKSIDATERARAERDEREEAYRAKRTAARAEFLATTDIKDLQLSVNWIRIETVIRGYNAGAGAVAVAKYLGLEIPEMPEFATVASYQRTPEQNQAVAEFVETVQNTVLGYAHKSNPNLVRAAMAAQLYADARDVDIYQDPKPDDDEEDED